MPCCGIVHVVQGNSRPPGLPPGGFDEGPPRGHQGVVVAPGEGVYDMVHGAERTLRRPDPAPIFVQRLQGNGPGALVQEYAVDVNQAAAVFQLADAVAVPQFVEQGLWHGRFIRHWRGARL